MPDQPNHASPAGPSIARRVVGQGKNTKLISLLGVFCLLLFCFDIMSRKLEVGEAAIVGAILAMVLRRVSPNFPAFFRWYVLYVVVGAIGYLVSSVPFKDPAGLIEVIKLTIIGLAACSLLTELKQVRIFLIGYLALFALFPVRGALYNYANGITEFGRISWNFFFSNPNDLAIVCLLPLGLCGFVMLTEKGALRVCAMVGISVLLLVVMLTQSRGAVLGAACGGLYFLMHTRRRLRVFLFVGLAAAAAAALAPQAVWERLGGLSKASMSDMSAVDVEGSAEARWEIMQVGWKIALDHPLVGVGLGNYVKAHAQRTLNNETIPRTARGFRDAHSAYIKGSAEAGLLGGLAIVMFFGWAIVMCRRIRWQVVATAPGARYENALLSLELSMVAYAAAAIFCSAERTTFTLLQFILPWAIGVAIATSVGAVPSPSPGRRRVAR